VKDTPTRASAGDTGGSNGDVHPDVAARLGSVDQRYTSGRRAIVATLAAAGRPLTVPEIIGDRLADDPASGAGRGPLPQSSAYRNLTVLVDAGVVRRVNGTDDHGRFELAEELAGHHHHLLCVSCGRVDDVSAVPTLERALDAAARLAAEATGFEVTGHRIDLVGRCATCRTG
jgi:Fur family ferric uptake transcriptional regulator